MWVCVSAGEYWVQVERHQFNLQLLPPPTAQQKKRQDKITIRATLVTASIHLQPHDDDDVDGCFSSCLFQVCVGDSVKPLTLS